MALGIKLVVTLPVTVRLLVDRVLATVTVLVDLSNVNPAVALTILLSLNSIFVFAPGAVKLPDILPVIFPADRFPPTNRLPAIPAPPATLSAPEVVSVAGVVGLIYS